MPERCSAKLTAGDGWTFAHCDLPIHEESKHAGHRSMFHRDAETLPALPVRALIVWDDAPVTAPVPVSL